MPERKRDGRPAGRGLHLPESVGGLVEAMKALVRGDLQPLETWNRERRPMLKATLEAWDSALGERLACGVVEEVFRAVRAGTEIDHEIPWMAEVARRMRVRIRRTERPIGAPLTAHAVAPAADPLGELIRREDRDRVRCVIAMLPARYQWAMRLRYVHGLSETDAASLVELRFGTRPEGTRWILKEGREMVKTGLEGRDPRVVY